MKETRRSQYLKQMKETESGGYAYAGDFYRLKGDAENGRRQRILIGAGAALLVLIVIGSGVIDAAGASDAFYVILPFIGEVSALFILCWNAVKLFAKKGIYREYVLETVLTRIPGAARMLSIFAAAGFLLSVYYLTRHGMEGHVFKSILYPALKLAAAGLSEGYRQFFEAREWEKVREPDN